MAKGFEVLPRERSHGSTLNRCRRLAKDFVATITSAIARVLIVSIGPTPQAGIQAEVLAFLRTQLVPGEPIRARELARLIQQEFGLDVHPRTIERVVSGKNFVITPVAVEKPSIVASTAVAQCETLRMAMLGEALLPEAPAG